jgi:hypothetical protein
MCFPQKRWKSAIPEIHPLSPTLDFLHSAESPLFCTRAAHARIPSTVGLSLVFPSIHSPFSVARAPPLKAPTRRGRRQQYTHTTSRSRHTSQHLLLKSWRSLHKLRNRTRIKSGLHLIKRSWSVFVCESVSVSVYTRVRERERTAGCTLPSPWCVCASARICRLKFSTRVITH